MKLFVVSRVNASTFFVCWWHTVGAALTSSNHGFEAQLADSGPRMVRNLDVNWGSVGRRGMAGGPANEEIFLKSSSERT